MKVIEYQRFKDLQHDGVRILNVLSADAFQKAHIPGSVNMPHDNPHFAEEVKNAIGSKDVPVIVYCASYSCDASMKAARKLDNEGFSNVMCYEGGTKEWQEKASARAA